MEGTNCVMELIKVVIHEIIFFGTSFIMAIFMTFKFIALRFIGLCMPLLARAYTSLPLVLR